MVKTWLFFNMAVT